MRAIRVLVVAVVLLGGCEAAPPPDTTLDRTATSSVGLSIDSTTTAPPTTQADVDERINERLGMVETQIVRRGVTDPIVIEAMQAVPRHRFVPQLMEEFAYRDQPLPIGHGQTISQPYIVALMSEALGVEPGDKVLEIGTGSGYQAAVLAEMGMSVFTMEIIPELADRAAEILRELDYAVELQTADGYLGWPGEAPFDAIIVTAAPDHVPQPLVEQLGDGGVLVIPVGPIGALQTLWRFTKDDGELLAESLAPVTFVPLTRAEE